MWKITRNRAGEPIDLQWQDVDWDYSDDDEIMGAIAEEQDEEVRWQRFGLVGI